MRSADLADETAHLTDAEFRAFILILAYCNENRAQEHDDTVYIARSKLLGIAPNKRGSVASATRVVRELVAKLTWELHEQDAKWSIRVRKWSENQGFAPVKLRHDSGETPATTPTPTPTPPPNGGGVVKSADALDSTAKDLCEPEFEPAPEFDTSDPPSSPKHESGSTALESPSPRDPYRLPPDTPKLTPKRIAVLIAMKPNGVIYNSHDVECWYAWKQPLMVVRGIKGFSKAAGTWFKNLRPGEIKEAKEWIRSCNGNASAQKIREELAKVSVDEFTPEELQKATDELFQ